MDCVSSVEPETTPLSAMRALASHFLFPVFLFFVHLSIYAFIQAAWPATVHGVTELDTTL